MTEQSDIELATWWAMGRDGIFLNSPGDVGLLPRFLAAASRFRARPSEAEMEERLRTSTEALELAVSTLSEKLAARRASYEQLVPSLTDLAERLHPLLERAAAPPQPVAPSPRREDEHLRFYVTEKGYEVSVVQGPPPQANTVVDRAEHGSAMVMKLGRSPLPADDRCCAYLLPTAPTRLPA